MWLDQVASPRCTQGRHTRDINETCYFLQ